MTTSEPTTSPSPAVDSREPAVRIGGLSLTQAAQMAGFGVLVLAVLAVVAWGGVALVGEGRREMAGVHAHQRAMVALHEPLPAAQVLPVTAPVSGFEVQGRVTAVADPLAAEHEQYDDPAWSIRLDVTQVLARDTSADLVGLARGSHLQLFRPRDAVTAPVSVQGRRAGSIAALHVGDLVTVVGNYEETDGAQWRIVGKHDVFMPAEFGFVWRAVATTTTADPTGHGAAFTKTGS